MDTLIFALDLVLALALTVVVVGGTLAAAGRESYPPAERRPVREWSLRDLWANLARGAAELAEARAVATGRSTRHGQQHPRVPL